MPTDDSQLLSGLQYFHTASLSLRFITFFSPPLPYPQMLAYQRGESSIPNFCGTDKRDHLKMYLRLVYVSKHCNAGKIWKHALKSFISCA